MTAAYVAFMRGFVTYTHNPVVSDPTAEHLLPAPFSLAVRAARALPGPATFLHDTARRLTDGQSSMVDLRTRAIDDAIADAVEHGASQLVILGAGLDGRAHRLASLRACSVFEVDYPATQAYKRSRAQALPTLASALHYTSMDFERDNLADRLAQTGHDARTPTIFLWEGVTMYLTANALNGTLRAVRACAAPGSTLLATYFRANTRIFLAEAAASVVGIAGEPFRSRFTPEQFADLLAAHEFTVIDDAGAPEWSEKYLDRRHRTDLERLARATYAG